MLCHRVSGFYPLAWPPTVSQSPRGWQSHVTEWNPLVTSSAFFLTFPPQCELPLFCHRGSRLLPEAHHPQTCGAWSPQWIWLFPSFQVCNIRASVDVFLLICLNWQQRQNWTRSLRMTLLPLLWSLTTRRAPLKRAEREENEQPNNFCACHQPPQKQPEFKGSSCALQLIHAQSFSYRA